MKDSVKKELEKLKSSFKKDSMRLYFKDNFWAWVSKVSYLSEEFIEEFIDKLNVDDVVRFQRLSGSFLEKKFKTFRGYYLFSGKCLSEYFLERHYEDLDWFDWLTISSHQILSESFIEKYENDVAWEGIFCFQDLSEDFIMRHSNKINKAILNSMLKHRKEKLSENLELFLKMRVSNDA